MSCSTIKITFVFLFMKNICNAYIFEIIPSVKLIKSKKNNSLALPVTEIFDCEKL